MGLNLNCKPWTPERLAEARKLARSKMTASEIAKSMGTTRSAVIGANFRHGIGLAPPGVYSLSANERRSASLKKAWAERRQPRMAE